jgi:hypothetical protein
VTPSSQSVRYYFVDEAGDGVLFDTKGRVIVGQPGCSRFFILGLLDVLQPDSLAKELEALRASLLSDRYFRDVPSMQPEAKKTALAFHATDDVPEVRREVFSLLQRQNLWFHAVVRNKHKLLEYVRQRGEREQIYRYNANELYDFLARRLFKPLLHKHDEYNVCFSKRGQAGRTKALWEALETAKRRFDEQYGAVSSSRIQMSSRRSSQCPELQAVDYFLWALQRLYEREDERYVEYCWNKTALVIDIDDTRSHRYGEYYTKTAPLSLAALQKKTPGI